ncbi:MAG: RluA family pseudouridine synthase [Holophagales bacterium]|jgi:23S rRNA pseudouridine1911/1915/1917 synthase|nr:RluA family pseudouridine synthase [Holophagales bacterium]
MGQQIKNWTVDSGDVALSGELRRALGVSHRQAKGLIDAGCVRVNNELAASHGQRLKDGDAITVNFDPDTSYHELPRPKKISDSEIKILWEDKHLVFVDKPAGMLSVPTEMSDESSLADALVEQYRKRGIKRPQIYIAHRIDRHTTGVIVFAKTQESIDGLKNLFHEHSINRVYKAILVGDLPENAGALHDKLIERTRSMKMAVVARRSGTPPPERAKPAMTHYRVIERLPGHTVVELRLETGRRNQIRVQFAERGFPLLGDHVYGTASPIIDRQALHAELLGLRHPVTDENITVQAPLPEDFEDALRKLRVLRRVERAKAAIKGEDGIFKPKETKERRESRMARSEARLKERTQRAGERAQQEDRPKYRAKRSENDDMQWGRHDEGHAPTKPRPTRYRREEERETTDSPRKATGTRRAGLDKDFTSAPKRGKREQRPDASTRKPSRDGNQKGMRAYGEKDAHRRHSDEPPESRGPRKSYPRRTRDGGEAEPGRPESKRSRTSYGRTGQESKEPAKRWSDRRDSKASGPKRGEFAKYAPTKAKSGSKPDSGSKRPARPPRRRGQ